MCGMPVQVVKYLSVMVRYTLSFGSQDHFIVNVFVIGCDDVRLNYNYGTGDCVETCPCGTYSLYGSCQPIISRFILIII